MKQSTKTMPKKLFEIVKNDVCSVTGSNLRNIMLLVNKTSIEELNPTDAENISYHIANEKDEWRINVAKELLQVKAGDLEIEGFDYKEIKDMTELICTT